MEVRDVRELRDFAYRVAHPGGRCLCAGLGLGGVPVCLLLLPNTRAATESGLRAGWHFHFLSAMV